MSKIIKSGIVRLISVDNNDYEAFAKEALEHFGCTDMTPYNTYLAKLVNDGDKLSDYKFMIVGKSLFQIGHIQDYSDTGFMGVFPGEKNGYFTFVSALNENENLIDCLKAYLTSMFSYINEFLNSGDLMEKWIAECPEEAQKALTKLGEMMDIK